MKQQTFKPVTFSYDKSMLDAFTAGHKKFTEQTHIILSGISWKVDGEQLVVTIIEEQQEKYFAHLFLCIGQCYSK